MWKQRGTTPIRFLVNEYLSSLPSEEEENVQIPQPALHPESPHPSSFQKPVTDVEMKDGMKTEQSNEEPPKKKVKMEANQLPFQPKPQIQIPGISLFAKDQSTPKATEDAEGQKSEAPKRIPALHKRRVQGPGIYLIPEFCDIALISFNSPFQLRILAKVVTQMRQVHEYHEKLKEFEKFIGIKFKDMKLLRQVQRALIIIYIFRPLLIHLMQLNIIIEIYIMITKDLNFWEMQLLKLSPQNSFLRIVNQHLKEF